MKGLCATTHTKGPRVSRNPKFIKEEKSRLLHHQYGGYGIRGWDRTSPFCCLLIVYMCMTLGEEGWGENKHWAATCVYISLFWMGERMRQTSHLKFEARQQECGEEENTLYRNRQLVICQACVPPELENLQSNRYDYGKYHIWSC